MPLTYGRSKFSHRPARDARRRPHTCHLVPTGRRVAAPGRTKCLLASGDEQGVKGWRGGDRRLLPIWAPPRDGVGRPTSQARTRSRQGVGSSLDGSEPTPQSESRRRRKHRRDHLGRARHTAQQAPHRRLMREGRPKVRGGRCEQASRTQRRPAVASARDAGTLGRKRAAGRARAFARRARAGRSGR